MRRRTRDCVVGTRSCVVTYRRSFSRTVREVPFLPSLDVRARIAQERVPTACKADCVPFSRATSKGPGHGLNLRVNDARIDAAKTKRVAQYVP